MARPNKKAEPDLSVLRRASVQGMDYTLQSLLGRGAFAEVWQAKTSSDEIVAVKVYKANKMKDSIVQKLVNDEVHVMQQLDHDNVIRLHEVHATHRGLHLVMDFAPGGSLFAFVRKHKFLTEDVAKPLFHQVCSAVQHMHSRNTVHRDIKLENVLFAANGELKLADFGLGAVLPTPDAKLSEFCGSMVYMSPELVSLKKYLAKPVDVWALGVMLYVLLSGQFPFWGTSEEDLKRLIIAGKPRWAPQISPMAKEFIEYFLNRDPVARPNMDAIMAHHWWTQSVYVPPKRNSIAGTLPDAQIAKLAAAAAAAAAPTVPAASAPPVPIGGAGSAPAHAAPARATPAALPAPAPSHAVAAAAAAAGAAGAAAVPHLASPNRGQRLHLEPIQPRSKPQPDVPVEKQADPQPRPELQSAPRKVPEPAPVAGTGAPAPTAVAPTQHPPARRDVHRVPAPVREREKPQPYMPFRPLAADPGPQGPARKASSRNVKSAPAVKKAVLPKARPALLEAHAAAKQPQLTAALQELGDPAVPAARPATSQHPGASILPAVRAAPVEAAASPPYLTRGPSGRVGKAGRDSFRGLTPSKSARKLGAAPVDRYGRDSDDEDAVTVTEDDLLRDLESSGPVSFPPSQPLALNMNGPVPSGSFRSPARMSHTASWYDLDPLRAAKKRLGLASSPSQLALITPGSLVYDPDLDRQ